MDWILQTSSLLIASTFGRWRLGPGWLLITGGARGADIIAAEQALRSGSEVLVLLALPEHEFIEASVALAGSNWERRFEALHARCWFRAPANAPNVSAARACRRGSWSLD